MARGMALSLVIAAALAGCALAAIPPGGVPDAVAFESGTVLGYRVPASNIRYWLSVPFAADTGGANAWLPPQPVQPWNFTMDCTFYGATCLSYVPTIRLARVMRRFTLSCRTASHMVA
jgi:hypothetical protein